MAFNDALARVLAKLGQAKDMSLGQIGQAGMRGIGKGVDAVKAAPGAAAIGGGMGYGLSEVMQDDPEDMSDEELQALAQRRMGYG